MAQVFDKRLLLKRMAKLVNGNDQKILKALDDFYKGRALDLSSVYLALFNMMSFNYDPMYEIQKIIFDSLREYSIGQAYLILVSLDSNIAYGKLEEFHMNILLDGEQRQKDVIIDITPKILKYYESKSLSFNPQEALKAIINYRNILNPDIFAIEFLLYDKLKELDINDANSRFYTLSTVFNAISFRGLELIGN